MPKNTSSRKKTQRKQDTSEPKLAFSTDNKIVKIVGSGMVFALILGVVSAIFTSGI